MNSKYDTYVNVSKWMCRESSYEGMKSEDYGGEYMSLSRLKGH